MYIQSSRRFKCGSSRSMLTRESFFASGASILEGNTQALCRTDKDLKFDVVLLYCSRHVILLSGSKVTKATLELSLDICICGICPRCEDDVRHSLGITSNTGTLIDSVHRAPPPQPNILALYTRIHAKSDGIDESNLLDNV